MNVLRYSLQINIFIYSTLHDREFHDTKDTFEHGYKDIDKDLFILNIGFWLTLTYTKENSEDSNEESKVYDKYDMKHEEDES